MISSPQHCCTTPPGHSSPDPQLSVCRRHSPVWFLLHHLLIHHSSKCYQHCPKYWTKRYNHLKYFVTMTVCLSIRAWVSMFVQQRISETFIYEQLMNSAARSCIEVTSQNSHIRSLTVHKVPRKLKNLFSLTLSCGTVKILKIKLEKQFWLIWYNLHLCFRKPSCKMSIDCRNFHSSHQTTNHLLNLNIKLILKIRIYKSQARLQEVTSFLGFF